MSLVNQFNQDGFVGPLKIMSSAEAKEYCQLVLDAETRLNLMDSDYRCKSNVLFPWVDKISRNPILISYLKQIIGPNIHCWDTLFWIKKPGDGKDVSFHQDATYWNFTNKHRAVTVWFAFNDVTEEHGSLEYVQGSHMVSQKRHKDIKTDSNLLMRGQTVDIDVPAQRIKTTVPAGHVLIHSPYMIHGSGVNAASTFRVAMGMIFASTECKPVLNISPESTVMIAGVDEYNYMQHDSCPTGVWETDVVAWRAAYDRQHLNYYKMEQDAI
jgi:ectoine hydroxylase-related dioxygenase (phytanoyl-CoA dioxygenase family)